MELLSANPNAFIVAYVIAYRGQYNDAFNRHGLGLGEALLGDFKKYGMSHRQYRTAVEQLSKWHFATFRTTNKGTIGKLTDTRLFSIFRLPADKQNDKQPTSSRQAADKQPTTTKNIRTEEQKNIDSDTGRGVELPHGFPATGEEAKIAAMFVGCPEDFAVDTWNKAMSRGGSDAKGQPIRSWRHYLASEWKFQTNRKAENEARRPLRPTSAPPDHSKGF